MDTFAIIFSAFAAIVLIFDIKIGLSLVLVYMFLVPVDFPFLFTTVNTVLQVGIILGLFKCVISKQGRYGTFYVSPLKYLLYMYIVLFGFTLFQSYVPFGRELQLFQNEIRLFFILPFAIWILCERDIILLGRLNNAMLFACSIILAYGIFLIFFSGFNPYVLYMSAISGKEISDTIMGTGEQVRLMNRISSVFFHPMSYGVYLVMLVVYLCSLLRSKNTILVYVLIAASVICIFMSGVRTSIIIFVLELTTFALLTHRVKYFFYLIPLGIVGFFIISQIPALYGTIDSIFNSNSDVGGSSIEMRLDQLDACFDEIRDCFIFGKGYNWSEYYMEKYTSHPRLLCFESKLFSVLCNWGLAGILIFIISYLKLIKATSRIISEQEKRALVLSLIVAFVGFCMITGDYNYMTYFTPFFVLTVLNCRETIN